MRTHEKDHEWRVGHGGFYGSVSVLPVHFPDVVARVRREAPLMLMTYLYVHPVCRGRGWSRDLLAAVTEWADRRGIDLWTYARPFDKGGPPAPDLERLYRQYGFRAVPRSVYKHELVRRCRGS